MIPRRGISETSISAIIRAISARCDTSALATVTLERDPSRYLVAPGDVLFLSRGHRVFAAACADSIFGATAKLFGFIR